MVEMYQFVIELIGRENFELGLCGAFGALAVIGYSIFNNTPKLSHDFIYETSATYDEKKKLRFIAPFTILIINILVSVPIGFGFAILIKPETKLAAAVCGIIWPKIVGYIQTKKTTDVLDVKDEI